MKIFLSSLLVVIMLFGMSGCATENGLTEPPQLSVILEGTAHTAPITNFGWTYKNTDTLSDGLHPLQTEREAVVTKDSVATLRFGSEPQRVYVEYWNADAKGDHTATSSYPHMDGNSFSLRKGNYIYAIHASWEGKNHNGSATYVIGIASSAEEPLLTAPPRLTVTYADKTAEAKLASYSWRYTEEDGTVKTVSQEGAHSLQLLTKEDRLTFDTPKIQIRFDEAPDRMKSYAWYDTDLGKTVGGNPIDDYWGVYSLSPANGGLIIEIHAYWENRDGLYEGDARYCFYLNKQEKE